MKYLPLLLWTHSLMSMQNMLLENITVLDAKKNMDHMVKKIAYDRELLQKACILDYLMKEHGTDYENSYLYQTVFNQWAQLSTKLLIEGMAELNFTFNNKLAREKINQWIRENPIEIVQYHGLVSFIVEKIKDDFAITMLNNLKKSAG